jgi:uncharacterized protein YkwD
MMMMMMRIKLGSAFFCCVLLVLAGCSTEDLNPLIGSTPDEAEVEAASFELINKERAKQGLSPLQFDTKVATIARAHSADMRDRNFYGHVNPDGRNFSDRLKTAGVTFRTAGENLALLSNNMDPAMSANTEFLKHSSHRANMLDRRFTRVGIGVARSGNKYWITQDFIGN